VLLIVSVVLAAAAAVVSIFCYIRVTKLAEPHRRFLAALGQMEFPDDLTAYLELLGQVHRRVEDLRVRADAMDRTQLKAFSSYGLVHFDAFDHMGGLMSFSLALVDHRGSGYILTGLHGRDSFDAYCRRVTEGRTEVDIMPEEAHALREALTGLDGR
jgi:hypothetical protein